MISLSEVAMMLQFTISNRPYSSFCKQCMFLKWKTHWDILDLVLPVEIMNSDSDSVFKLKIKEWVEEIM